MRVEHLETRKEASQSNSGSDRSHLPPIKLSLRETVSKTVNANTRRDVPSENPISSTSGRNVLENDKNYAANKHKQGGTPSKEVSAKQSDVKLLKPWRHDR